MQFSFGVVAIVAALSGQAIASACFDSVDCALQGGGTCVKAAHKILGTCSKGAKTAGPTQTQPLPTQSAAPKSCFTSSDCVKVGGSCIKQKGKLVGVCVKSRRFKN